MGSKPDHWQIVHRNSGRSMTMHASEGKLIIQLTDGARPMSISIEPAQAKDMAGALGRMISQISPKPAADPKLGEKSEATPLPGAPTGN